VAGTVQESKFGSTVRDGNGNVLGGIRDGNRLPTVPEFQIAVTADYLLPLTDDMGLNLIANYQHVGNRYTQPSDQENNPRAVVSGLAFNGATGTGVTTVNLLLPSYDLINLSAGLTFKSLDADIVAYVNNLTDDHVLLSFDRERGGRARLGFNTGQPRSYGLTLRKRF
jgi:iron complex outermembrane receptor protein